MAKQLDFLPQGKVIPTALHSEMQQSYLEYAMSVIVGRALPDVRDGLKPVPHVRQRPPDDHTHGVFQVGLLHL